MKQLILVRHAKSDWSLPDIVDWDRPLNKRGIRDAPEMGRRLRSRRLKPDLILTSPAVRALATARVMAKELRVPARHVREDERLYLAAPAVMLDVVREHGGELRYLMVVGHNPGITEFADKLSSERRIDHMPTCAIVTMQFDFRAWSDINWESGVEVDLDYPRNSP